MLGLSKNRFGDAGLAALSEAGFPPTLTVLGLGGNQIGDAGLAALASAGFPPTLKELYLGGNSKVQDIAAAGAALEAVAPAGCRVQVG